MMPMPLHMISPAPQEWSLAVNFSPFRAVPRLVEAQVDMTLAVAGLALALSPLGLAGAVGRRASAPKPATTGSVIPMVRPALATVPSAGASKPVPPKPRPVRPAAKKVARPAPAPVKPAAKPAAKVPAKPAPVAATPEAAPPAAAAAKPKAPRAKAAPKPAPAPQPATATDRPRARRTPARPVQPFKVEE